MLPFVQDGARICGYLYCYVCICINKYQKDSKEISSSSEYKGLVAEAGGNKILIIYFFALILNYERKCKKVVNKEGD